MMGGFFDHGKTRQKRLQVQSQMHLGGGLAAAMFGPVHAVGHQRNGRRIDSMHGPLESPGQSAVTSRRTKAAKLRLQVLQRLPEEGLHHIAVAVPVGVRQAIAAGSGGTPNRSQFGCVMTQALAHVVQSNGVSQLRVKQTHHVAPGRKRTALRLHAGLDG